MLKQPHVFSPELVQAAYKKLKSSAYYDKSQAPLRDAIVAFESTADFELQLMDMHAALTASDEYWMKYSQNLIDTISFYMLPKSISPIKHEQLILNFDESIPKITKYQYYIKMDVAGHIFGVLWLLTIGKMIDDDTYEHAYGNRLNQHLLNDKGCVTFSPTLFEPYIAQYGSWRDRALRLAEEHLDDKEDVFILTLDFQSFFYNVNVSKNKYDELLHTYQQKIEELDDSCPTWLNRVHAFVWQVLERYTEILQQYDVLLEAESHEEGKQNTAPRHVSNSITHMLPIGFLPCNVLSNWILKGFDEAIVNRWNPLYYGRYVDDIIIVDKVEKNSILYKAAREKQHKGAASLTADSIVERFMCNCRNRDIDTPCQNGIFIKPDEKTYRIHESILEHIGSLIDVQRSKLKVFYFRNGTSRALLTRFREDIARNASEFRVLPELDDALDFGNYSSIIGLERDDTINKLRGIKSVSVDRFELSKFLGKYSVVSTLIDEPKSSAFERDLLSIFDDATILANYTLWERLLEILVVGNNWAAYTDIALKIIDTIQRLDHVNADPNIDFCIDSLNRFLFASIRRTTALCWNTKVSSTLDKLAVRIAKPGFRGLPLENQSLRLGYLQTRMVNKSAIPMLLDLISLDQLKQNPTASLNLTNLHDVMKNLRDIAEAHDNQPYIYYPYWVKPQDIGYSHLCQGLAHCHVLQSDQEQNVGIQNSYWQCNYGATPNESVTQSAVEAIPFERKDCTKERHIRQEVIHVASDAQSKLRVAIGNARVNAKDFEDTLKHKKTRSFARYQQMIHIIDEAIRERCNLLVLPELYMPLEWLPAIARKCASEQFAIVTGLDFVIGCRENEAPVYNLTAVILPYECDHQKHAYISYHHKVHYSPAEQDLIRKYGFKPMSGNTYQLYSWHDVWFSVYCCFELACIQDRALFSSLSDVTIGIEWNKDTPYFDHVSNSLARDLHCYVIEANTSQYGGSGVIQPQSSVTSELIRTKGGDNHSILTTDIDIQALREAQYPDISDRKSFKPLPPIFDRGYIKARYDGSLWRKLNSELERHQQEKM